MVNCPDNSVLAQLLQRAAHLVPALQGRLSQTELSGQAAQTAIVYGRDNRQQLLALYQYWCQQHPEATHAYWWVRSWSMLIWQPVYLSVIAVHSAGINVSLARFSQHYQQGVVAGFTLTPQCGQVMISTASAIKSSAAELAAFYQHTLAELAQVTQLRPALAGRLLADAVLSALLLWYQQARCLPPQQLRQWGQQWLDGLGLDITAAFYTDALTQQPVVKRRACCLHYLRADGGLCGNCPKRAKRASPSPVKITDDG